MENIAADLLKMEGTRRLARSDLRRSMLTGGRVEAHEFGRDRHSSASAGGLILLCKSSEVNGKMNTIGGATRVALSCRSCRISR